MTPKCDTCNNLGHLAEKECHRHDWASVTPFSENIMNKTKADLASASIDDQADEEAKSFSV